MTDKEVMEHFRETLFSGENSPENVLKWYQKKKFKEALTKTIEIKAKKFSIGTKLILLKQIIFNNKIGIVLKFDKVTGKRIDKEVYEIKLTNTIFDRTVNK